MILVIGATGNIGSEIVKLCVEDGTPVKGAARSPEKLIKLYGNKVETTHFDFNDESTWKSSLDGIDTVFFIAPQTDAHTSVQSFLAMLKNSSVANVLYSSGRTTGGITGSPMNKVEQVVQQSGIPFTIIRPGWFMQNFNGWIGDTLSTDRAFYLSAGRSKTAFVDVRDIAAVAHKILKNSSHVGEILELSGEEALDHYQVAGTISDVTGIEVRYVELSSEEYLRHLVKQGWPEQDAAFFAYLYDLVRLGNEEDISPDVRKVLGRAPITFTDFARDYRLEFLRLLNG